MEPREIIHLVEQKDLNHHGTLFAAVMASWFVEAGFVTAALEYGDTADLVCVGIKDMKFMNPARAGSIIKLTGQVIKTGTTSLTIEVKGVDSLKNTDIVTGIITFVCVDEDTGIKKPHGLSISQRNTD